MYLKLNRVPFNVIWYVSNEHVDWDLCQNKSSRWKIALLWIKLKWHFSPGQCFLISKFDATTFRKISIWKTRSKTLFYRSKKLPNSGFRCWNRYNDIKYMPQTYTCKVKPVWSHSCVIRFTVLTNTDFHTLLTVFYVVFFLHYVIRHPFYPGTTCLCQGKLHLISVIVFISNCLYTMFKQKHSEISPLTIQFVFLQNIVTFYNYNLFLFYFFLY